MNTNPPNRARIGFAAPWSGVSWSLASSSLHKPGGSTIDTTSQRRAVIVCGDFNDLPPGYIHQKIRAELRNAFEQKGLGIGGTSNKPGLRLARIDHLFASTAIETIAFTTHSEQKLSDHYPISGVFRPKRDLQ